MKTCQRCGATYDRAVLVPMQCDCAQVSLQERKQAIRNLKKTNRVLVDENRQLRDELAALKAQRSAA